jgi:hypothetical protein
MTHIGLYFVKHSIFESTTLTGAISAYVLSQVWAYEGILQYSDKLKVGQIMGQERFMILSLVVVALLFLAWQAV